MPEEKYLDAMKKAVKQSNEEQKALVDNYEIIKEFNELYSATVLGEYGSIFKKDVEQFILTKLKEKDEEIEDLKDKINNLESVLEMKEEFINNLKN